MWLHQQFHVSLLQLLIFTNVTTTLSACKRVDVDDGNATYVS